MQHRMFVVTSVEKDNIWTTEYVNSSHEIQNDQTRRSYSSRTVRSHHHQQHSRRETNVEQSISIRLNGVSSSTFRSRRSEGEFRLGFWRVVVVLQFLSSNLLVIYLVQLRDIHRSKLCVEEFIKRALEPEIVK